MHGHISAICYINAPFLSPTIFYVVLIAINYGLQVEIKLRDTGQTKRNIICICRWNIKRNEASKIVKIQVNLELPSSYEVRAFLGGGVPY